MKCKECKFRCHTQCQGRVPPSCGLPEDLLQHFMDQLASDGSPILPRAHQEKRLLMCNRGPYEHINLSIWNSSSRCKIVHIQLKEHDLINILKGSAAQLNKLV